MFDVKYAQNETWTDARDALLMKCQLRHRSTIRLLCDAVWWVGYGCPKAKGFARQVLLFCLRPGGASGYGCLAVNGGS